MVKKGCRECGELVGRFQHQQKTDEARGMHFFKVLLGDFGSKLGIPPAFARHISVNKCANATLNSHASISWPVKVYKENNLLFLRDGWPEFTKHHSLQHGGFLVFKHNGDLDFDVRIFDRSGCETVAASLTKSGKLPEMEAETSGPILGGDRENKSANHGKALCLSDRPAYMSTFRHASKRRKVTEEERLRALEAANNLNLSGPHFIVTMTESSVYKRWALNVPKSFVLRYPLNKTVTLRRPNGMSWEVGYRYVDGRGKLVGGWGRFLLANNLEEGDVCVFELTEAGSVMDVHIFKVVDGAKN